VIKIAYSEHNTDSSESLEEKKPWFKIISPLEKIVAPIVSFGLGMMDDYLQACPGSRALLLYSVLYYPRTKDLTISLNQSFINVASYSLGRCAKSICQYVS